MLMNGASQQVLPNVQDGDKQFTMSSSTRRFFYLRLQVQSTLWLKRC